MMVEKILELKKKTISLKKNKTHLKTKHKEHNTRGPDYKK